MKKRLILPIIFLLLSIFTISASAYDATSNINTIDITTEVSFIVEGATSTKSNYVVVDDMVYTNEINKYTYTITDSRFDIKTLPDATTVFGLTKPGYHFTGWELPQNDFSDDIKSNTDNFSSSALMLNNRVVSIVVKAHWEPNTYTIFYNINQGIIENSDKYTYNEKGYVVSAKTKKAYTQNFEYSETASNGLVNATSFNLNRDGYIFVGWSTNKNGTDLFDQDDSTISPEKLLINSTQKDKPNIVLYAQWLPEKISIVYMNDEDAKINNWKYEEKNGFLKNKFSLNILSQKFKTNSKNTIKVLDNIFELSKEYEKFAGWSTKPDGEGIILNPGDIITNSMVVPYINNNAKVLRLYPVWEKYIIPLDTSSGVHISSLQGGRIHPIYNEYRYHAGLDIAANEGVSIYATADGVVTEVGVDTGVGYGNYVKLQHKDGIETLYAHASKTLVEVGDEVKQGDTIALVGTTGTSTGNHLHFEMIIDGERVDPMKYVNFENIPINI